MKMKRLAVLVYVASMTMGALAFPFMGPPTAELDKGQWEAGYIFSYSEVDIEGTETSFNGDKYTFKPGEIMRHYFDLGYGVIDTLELNLLLGVASVDLGDFEYDDGSKSPGDFTGSDDFSYGFNAKYTAVDNETIDWGAMLQMTWFSGDGKWSGTDEELDAYDLQIAVGPTIDLGVCDLYGGGYFYMLDGELRAIGVWKDDLEEEDSYGGYIGAAVQIMENIDFSIECAASVDTIAMGGNIGWRF